jgi:hypothetical protein
VVSLLDFYRVNEIDTRDGPKRNFLRCRPTSPAQWLCAHSFDIGGHGATSHLLSIFFCLLFQMLERFLQLPSKNQDILLSLVIWAWTIILIALHAIFLPMHLLFVPSVIVTSLLVAIFLRQYLSTHEVLHRDPCSVCLLDVMRPIGDGGAVCKVHVESPIRCGDNTVNASKVAREEASSLVKTLPVFETKEGPCEDIIMLGKAVFASDTHMDPVISPVAALSSIRTNKLLREPSGDICDISQCNRSETDSSVQEESHSSCDRDLNIPELNNSQFGMSTLLVSIPFDNNLSPGEDVYLIGSAERSEEEARTMSGDRGGPEDLDGYHSSSLHDAESRASASEGEQRPEDERSITSHSLSLHDVASVAISTDISKPSSFIPISDAMCALMRDDELDVVAALK